MLEALKYGTSTKKFLGAALKKGTSTKQNFRYSKPCSGLVLNFKCHGDRSHSNVVRTKTSRHTVWCPRTMNIGFWWRDKSVTLCHFSTTVSHSNVPQPEPNVHTMNFIVCSEIPKIFEPRPTKKSK